MGIFNRKNKIEERTDLITPNSDGILLSALLGRSTAITKIEALNIPSIQGCIDFTANTVSMLPIKLYKDNNGEVEEVKDDIRVKLLNDDPRDTLDSVQFWRAIITDYYLGKGGYAYINKYDNQCVSLHYIDEAQVSTNKNVDPIFKEYTIYVNGKAYYPYEFIKILRNTKDGVQGTSIINDNSRILSVAYESLKFEENLVKKGGNKKGFLTSPRKLTQPVIDQLKEAWKKLYGNNEDNVVVLNDGLEFKESSNTSVELQLNENKSTNAIEICKLFLISAAVIEGKATHDDYKNSFRNGVQPILKAIECALNRSLLLEKEKDEYYFVFDTKEMLKGDIKERYDAYKIAIDSNFMKIDEVRYKEDMKPLGLNWLKLGLDSVLYNPDTKEIYTPNTNKTTVLPADQTVSVPENLNITKGDIKTDES